MLSRTGARSAVSVGRSSRGFSTTPVVEATLRELESRIKSVKNIEKITKSMGMIATTRLNKAQAAMRTAKAYGATSGTIFDETKPSEKDKEAESVEATSGESKTLWIVVSSDRGLCGGIHSSVSKAGKKALANDNGQSPLVVLGDKPKQQLSRAIPQNLVLSFNQIGREIPTFADACAIVEQIEASNIKYDNVKIIYNKFVSSLSYESAVMEVGNAASLKSSPAFKAYELEDDVLVGDLSSFALTNAIYACLVEGHATEISARRNAMDNASKNAKDMIDKLQMQFNRMRQTTITNDLVDIITGANAL